MPGEERLGPYRVLRRLGAGGMGVVDEAVHEQTGARYALKRLTREAAADPETRLRFVREAHALAALEHPHVLRVHAAELEGPDPYLVLPLLSGDTLGARLQQGPLPLPEARRVFEQLLDALAHAHARGVLHRDLKPENVLFDERGQVVLSDFGLVRVTGQASLTATGALMGTPEWMAPEQARDSSLVGARADVYGLGALLYAMLAGTPPVPDDGRGLVSLLLRVQSERPRPVQELRPDAPRDLAAVCARALEKDPQRRWESAGALQRAMRTPAVSPLRGWLVGLTLLLVLVGGRWWLRASPPSGPGPSPLPSIQPAPTPASLSTTRGDPSPLPSARGAATPARSWELIPLLAERARHPRGDFEGERITLLADGLHQVPRRFAGLRAPIPTLVSPMPELGAQPGVLLCPPGQRYVGLYDGPITGLATADGDSGEHMPLGKLSMGSWAGELLIVLEYQRAVHVRKVSPNDPLVSLPLDHARTARFAPDGVTVIAGAVGPAGGGEVALWRPGASQWVERARLPSDVRGADLHPDGQRVALGDGLGLVGEYAWPLASEAQPLTRYRRPGYGAGSQADVLPRSHTGPLRDVCYLDEGRCLATLAELEGNGKRLQLAVWDTASQALLGEWTLPDQPGSVQGLQTSPQRDQLLLCTHEQVWLLTRLRPR